MEKAIFHAERNILDGFDASCYAVEDLKQNIEDDLHMDAPCCLLQLAQDYFKTRLPHQGRVSQMRRYGGAGYDRWCWLGLMYFLEQRFPAIGSVLQ